MKTSNYEVLMIFKCISSTYILFHFCQAGWQGDGCGRGVDKVPLWPPVALDTGVKLEDGANYVNMTQPVTVE